MSPLSSFVALKIGGPRGAVTPGDLAGTSVEGPDVPHPSSRAIPSCTAQRPSGAFCDYESLPDAPFPICLKHASMVLRYLNDRTPHPDDLMGRVLLAARDFEHGAKRPIERAGKMAPPALPAVVYYLQVGELVKIGYTANLMQRMDTYPPDSKLLAVEPGGKDVERDRHRQFHHALGLGREWFVPDDELLEHITRVAREHDIRDYYEPRQRKPSMAVDENGEEIA